MLPIECYDNLKSNCKPGKCFDGLVVKTSRCGREDSGSTPGRGNDFLFLYFFQMTLFGINKIPLVTPHC